jgi:hypothetical protein
VHTIGRLPQRAPDGAPVHCDECNRPEQTTLYRLVQRHAASFVGHTETSTGSELPRFIKDEFGAFPECGILAHGFLSLPSGECGHDKLLAFGCNRRGLQLLMQRPQDFADRGAHGRPHDPERAGASVDAWKSSSSKQEPQSRLRVDAARNARYPLADEGYSPSLGDLRKGIMKAIFSIKLALIATALGCVAGANNAHALIVTAGCANANLTCTLQELASGGSIIVDDKLFDNWFVDDASTVQIDLSSITVAGLDDQPSNPGLQYVAGGHLSTVGFELIDLDLRFNVTARPGLMAIAGTSLQIDQVAFAGGNIGGFIGIAEDIFKENGVDLFGEQSVFADNLLNSMKLFDSIEFSSIASIVVVTNIVVTGDDTGDIVSIDRFTQRVAQVPEPPTMLLVLVGLTGLVMTKRRLIEVESR